MTPDFDALHQQLANLSRAAYLPFDERAPSDQVATAIGRTIAALAGWPAMSAAFDYIELHVGEREAVWLSRRWSGITDPKGATWG